MKTILYRRKREGKTDYRKRQLLIKSGKPRIAVRKSNKHTTIQIIEYHQQGDKITFAASTQELKKYGWKGPTGNKEAAYLAGYLLGKKAGKIEAVPDIGMHTSVKENRTYAALDGSRQAGIQLKIGEKMAPQKYKEIDQTKKKIEETKWQTK